MRDGSDASRPRTLPPCNLPTARAARSPLIAGALLGAILLSSCGSADGDTRRASPATAGTAASSAGGHGAGGLGGLIGVGNNVAGDKGCATGRSSTQRSPVYLQFVLDASGSMYKQNKWDAVFSALGTFIDAQAAVSDPGFGFGLTVFSGAADPTNGFGPYPTVRDVPVRAMDEEQRSALHRRLDNNNPEGATPTLRALTGAYGALAKFAPESPLLPGGKKAVVLMTDGVPESRPGPTDPVTPTAIEQDACIERAKDALLDAEGGPIQTLVVGVGPFPPTDPAQYDPAFLGRLAQAGGLAPAGCNPGETSDPGKACYFQITPGDEKTADVLAKEFLAAIEAIRGLVTSCEFILDVSSSQVDPDKVNVTYLDGSGVEHPLKQDLRNGWTYDDPARPTKVLLHGAACEAVKRDPRVKVDIVLGCTTIVN